LRMPSPTLLLQAGGDRFHAGAHREGVGPLIRLEGRKPVTKKVSTRPFDSADYVNSPEAAAAYIEAALEEGDPQIISATLGDIARSKDLASIAEQTGLAYETLCKSLSADGDPGLTTLLVVLRVLGLRLSVAVDGH